VPLPPLRERLADILPLAEHFLAHAARGTVPKRLGSDAAARLLGHLWPGNVRELRNVIERVTTLVRRPVIVACDLEFLGTACPDTEKPIDWLAGTLPEAVARLETEMIHRALEASAGNRA
jgi:DNA-binding NtrC family response regulator